MNTGSDRDAPFRYFLVRRWQGMRWSEEMDSLVVEEPLEIRLNNQTLAVIMRTPGDEFELALGFLLAEGFLSQVDYSTFEINTSKIWWRRFNNGLVFVNPNDQ